jgi:protein dithiol oxidoreductase (disulfide-forming)
MRNLYRSLALSLVAGFAHTLAAAPVAGKDYEVLKVAHPTSAPPGKVEVIEFFWYQDRNSYLLEPSIEAFVKKEGDRIVFKRAAVAVEDWCSAHSVLYYSLVSFGLGEKLMLTVYDEIQKKKNHLLTWDELADFLATQGVDRRKFLLAQGSANEMALIEQGGKLRGDYQIHYLPTLVVAGRYKIGPVGNGPDGMATVLDYLVKQVQDKKL